MKIAVENLRPNPFRDLGRYPVDKVKVDALVKSIEATEFWDNLVARKDPDNGDVYQLAYGVHRLAALKRSGTAEVDIPVRKLTDEIMIKIMAHENQVEWGSTALIDQETVRAIVLAFGAGKIELPTVRDGDGHGGSRQARYAPSFIANDLKPERQDFKYTAGTLSKFLGGEKAGWPDGKIEAILATLGVMERGLVEREDLEGLSTHQAAEVARQARRVAKETGDTRLAKSIGKKLAGGMHTATGRPPGRGGKKKGTGQAVTYHGAKRAADEMMGTHRRKNAPKKMPPIEKFAEQLSISIGAAFPTETMQAKLDAILQYKDELPAGLRTGLVRSLRSLANRATKFADKLEG